MIILSCGHTVDDFNQSHDIIVKTTDRAGEKAISYQTVCRTCMDKYQRIGYIFETQEQALAWLQTEAW